MYEWRKMTDEERAEVLRQRKGRKLPWHSPPRVKYSGFVSIIFTASCYEHFPIIGVSPERMRECEEELFEICQKTTSKLYAWCILPNHYHLLFRTEKLEELKAKVGKFHGRTARRWNLEDNRKIKSKRHLWASINYIHNNPVHHGYTNKWQDWAFSSANSYLESVGREEAIRIWKEYPVLDYGKDWDIY
jgi:putative transposase